MVMLIHRALLHGGYMSKGAQFAQAGASRSPECWGKLSKEPVASECGSQSRINASVRMQPIAIGMRLNLKNILRQRGSVRFKIASEM
jgi:hypothetical protein